MPHQPSKKKNLLHFIPISIFQTISSTVAGIPSSIIHTIGHSARASLFCAPKVWLIHSLFSLRPALNKRELYGGQLSLLFKLSL